MFFRQDGPFFTLEDDSGELGTRKLAVLFFGEREGPSRQMGILLDVDQVIAVPIDLEISRVR